jgi:hypothetical protein
MKTHINRKNICIDVFTDIDFNKCKKYILSGYTYKQYINIIYNSIETNNHKTDTNNHTNNHTNHLKLTENHCIDEFHVICEYCNKVLNHKRSLSRHLRNCKVKCNIIDQQKLEIKQLKNRINELKNDNEELKEFSDELLVEMKNTNKLVLEQQKMINNNKKSNTLNNTIIGDNNINNINNITINAFDNTSLDYLTNDEIYECLKTMSDSYVRVLEKIHFNKNNPENQNIYISNLRMDTMRVFNGNLWTTTDKEETLVKICDNFTSIFDDFIGYCENNNKFPKLQSKYYKYQQQITENDEEYDKMYKKVENCIYDNSKTKKNKLF